MKQPSYMFSAWENYREWESTCPYCEWTGLLSQAKPDYETAMVSSLHCPRCDRKLALMNNQASFSEILEFAEKGSKQAIHHLKNFKCQQCQKSEGLREAIYGEPAFEIDESKFYVADSEEVGQAVVCVLCGWGVGPEYA
jgi:hypothetical protein